MRFENHCSCRGHQVNGLKGSIGIAVLLKSNSSTLMSPITTSLVEPKDPNTPSSTIIDATDATILESVIKA
jgi:hypothetical protein